MQTANIIEKIKEFSLDIMRHNGYDVGKIEISVNCARNSAVAKIKTTELIKAGGTEKEILITKLL
jgi:hypothetical protein